MAVVFASVACVLVLIAPIRFEGECLCVPVPVPWARQATSLEFRPVVRLTTDFSVLVDGAELGGVKALDAVDLQRTVNEAATRMTRTTEADHQSTDARAVNLLIRSDAPMQAVKALLRSCTQAGLTHWNLAVETVGLEE